MSIKNSFFTIDFEDFRYDFLNKRGLSKKTSPDGLHQSYAEIKKVLENQNGDKKCTFFCTGNVAEHSPELIKQISDDGHEIACHSNEHKDVSKQSNYEFERDIEKAINSLTKASGFEIKGYRAPMFSLPKEDTVKYSILEKYFKYDSSLILNKNEINNFYQNGRYKNTRLKVLPIYNKKTLFIYKKIIGGTYLKISNKNDLDTYMSESYEHNIHPIIYMHPYEFNNNKEFWISMNDLKDARLNIFEKYYYQIRQHQWHSFNKSTVEKLSYLLKKYPNKGRIDICLEIK